MVRGVGDVPGYRSGIACVLLALGLAACAKSANARAIEETDRAERSAAVAEGLAVRAELDALEGRLLAARTASRVWGDLSIRHRSVSAVACKSAEMHARAMAIQEPCGRAPPGRRIATASGGIGDGRGRVSPVPSGERQDEGRASGL
jgi:hypothetical protein